MLAGAVAGITLMLTGCGWLSGKPPGRGDPGNRRLHQLAADPIFSSLPPGAEDGELTLIPASYRRSTFEPSGWNGPGVAKTFASSAPPVSVYEFYGERARVEGWTVVGIGSLHLPSTWRKAYPNGAMGFLSIFTPRPFEPADGPRQYQLRGSISLPS
jgi:hypothetical protein